ncbi:hypothetical protein BDV12DRAFT_5565 [Aspergillus spectabilis]
MGFFSILSIPFSVIIIYPVYYVAFCAYFLLALLASPFVYLGTLGLWLTLLPLKILISLQPLLIYLAVASLLGAGLGSVLYYMTTLTIDVVLRQLPNPLTSARLKPRREHRAIEGASYTPSRDSIVRNDSWNSWSWGLDTIPLKKSGLASETILEEDSQESELSLTS